MKQTAKGRVQNGSIQRIARNTVKQAIGCVFGRPRQKKTSADGNSQDHNETGRKR